MATSIAVLVPVLRRPHRVEPLLESLAASARLTDLNAVFLANPEDGEEIAAVEEAGKRFPLELIVVPWESGHGDYARKMCLGAERAGEEFVFLAADDLTFHPGWAERALAAHLETGACVVGTNDLGNRSTQRGTHSTHTLVHRDYLKCGTVDEPGVLLHRGYGHAFVDNELVDTAKWRDTWTHATDSLVEHSHPFWGTEKTDEVYAKGQSTFAADRVLYESRKHLWQG